MGKLRALIGGLALALGLIFALPVHAEAPVHMKALIAPSRIALLVTRNLLNKEEALLSPQNYARSILLDKGFSVSEWNCLVDLWNRESHWNYKAKNPTSSAYGIAQMLTETSKSPAIQIERGVHYIEQRYGTPCEALEFHSRHNWY